MPRWVFAAFVPAIFIDFAVSDVFELPLHSYDYDGVSAKKAETEQDS